MRPLLSVVLVPSDPMNDDIALDSGIGKNNFRQFLLHLRHRFKRCRGGGLRNSLNDAGILGGEKTFWNCDVKDTSEHQGTQRNEQRYGLVAKNESQGTAIERDDFLESVFRDVIEATLLFRAACSGAGVPTSLGSGSAKRRRKER